MLKPLLPSSTIDASTGSKQRWGGLYGSATALAITQALSHKSPSLVLTSDIAKANRVVEELNFFLKTEDSKTSPVHFFADWETLPYDSFSPHDDIVSNRLETLYRLQQNKPIIVVAAINTVMSPISPAQWLQQQSFIIKINDQLNGSDLRLNLEKAGYRYVDSVYQHGEFAIRGSLIDLYPMGSSLPYRIDLFDDEVESLRTFDPETQRSLEKIDQISLLPGKEFPLDQKGIRNFREQWHERFDVDHRECPVYQDISNGIAPAGIEYYLPLFFKKCDSLLDYFLSGDDKLNDRSLFLVGDIETAADHYWREIHQRYESRQGDIQRPILKPAEIFFPVAELFSRFKSFRQYKLGEHTAPDIDFQTSALPPLEIEAQKKNPYQKLESFLNQFQGQVLFCAESSGRREALLTSLSKAKIKPQHIKSWTDFFQSQETLAITEGLLENGFQTETFALITETQLFGQQVKQRRRRRSDHDNNEQLIKNLTELQVGAPVVHIDHGVGRYRGLETITVDNQTNEFLMLEYAEGAKLYVPVTHLHLINRYSGSEESLAPLHKLGSGQWQKAREKAAKEVRDVAADLLAIYAKRDSREGHSFSLNKSDYQIFSNSFPFEETPDQESAIEAVREDMLSSKPMDRLVCGDVGFGKTEVAMRAAFIATQAGKQVAVLVPTTLLAQQHYDNFVDRFVDWPINVEVISRFRTEKDIKEIEKKIESGNIDILIGTHKIITSQLDFKSLGLLIIDEEHRFGVRQKEAIKAMRSEVDILTLTATPIPRTLNMAMHSIRDLSIIATPPARRLSVKTFVRQWDDNLIKEAILREILRGGQVYFLHNDVKSIEKTARELEEMIPEARVGIAHGQLREKQLEQVMSDFYHQRHNILVCSTIIETGIDVPNANTIIIERADKFGLAQLHQLRGRVGRSHHQAYAYLLTPHPKQMTGDAEKRLDAILQADDLGAGFTLATHDLEIRGAGQLLGEEQSGQMQAIGFSLYMEMLEQTIAAIKEGKKLSEADIGVQSSIDVNLHIPALIPDDYLPDVHTRLIFYKRLSAIKDQQGFDDLQVEMIDRFGLLPEPSKHLIRVTQIKLIAEELGIRKIEANARRGLIEFDNTPQIDPLTIVKMVQHQPQNYQLRGANQLIFNFEMIGAEERLQTVEAILGQLTKKH